MDSLSGGANEKRDDEQQSDHCFLCIAPNLAEAEDVAERGDQYKRQEDPRQLAATAKYAHSAEKRDGDDVKFETNSVVGAGVGEPRREDNAGDCANQLH